MSDLDAQDKTRALLKGQTEWGRWGSATHHERYMAETPNKRRKCHCGCEGRITHYGAANGVTLMSGCEMSVRRWVRS